MRRWRENFPDWQLKLKEFSLCYIQLDLSISQDSIACFYLGEMDLKAHVCLGMFIDMQSWCLSSVTAFCVRARSFQEGQVKVSPKSLTTEHGL